MYLNIMNNKKTGKTRLSIRRGFRDNDGKVRNVTIENLGDLDSAVTYYLRSLDADEFYLSDHAYFSLGRVYEAKKEYDNAISAYEKIIEEHVTSPWASLAKSRIISLNADKAE